MPRLTKGERERRDLQFALNQSLTNLEVADARANTAEAANAKLARVLAVRTGQLASAVEIFEAIMADGPIYRGGGREVTVPFTLVTALIRGTKLENPNVN